MMNENEVDMELATIDTNNYVGSPINRDLVVSFGDTLMGVHPNAKEIGVLGMRTVAQLALVTGANPLPGTNGIHAWESKGKLCIQFGMGYWRSKADREGGILWVTRPRIMTDGERRDYGINDNQSASICIGALKRDVVSLLHEMRKLDIEMTYTEAKQEVSRVGIGTVNPGEYDKQGRPRQWTADLRAERDLLRQLVPVLTPGRENENRTIKTGGADWDLSHYTKDMIPPTIDDDYDIDDANADFFDDDTINGELIMDDELPDPPRQAAKQPPPQQQPAPQPATPPDEQATAPTTAMLKDLHTKGGMKYGQRWKGIVEDYHAKFETKPVDGKLSTKSWTLPQYWEVWNAMDEETE